MNLPKQLFKPRTLSLLLSLSASCVYAEAQSNVSAVELDKVVSQGKNRSTRTEHLNAYTTSAMRTTTGLALSSKETPQSVSVITKTQLEQQAITTMENALKNTTGINVIPDSGRYRYQSRGFYIDQIEEDGISSTVAGSSSNPYRDGQSMTDLAVYDHIEVVRGATGLTQANGEPGGTINAVRKRPTSDAHVQGDVLMNRFGKFRLSGDVSGSLNEAESVRGRLIAVGERSNGHKDNDQGKLGLLYGVVETDLGENSKLTAGVLHQNKTETADYFGVPLNADGKDFGFDRKTYLGYDWNEAQFKKTHWFAEAEHFINPDWKATAKVSHILSDSDAQLGAIYDASTSYAGLKAGDTLKTNNLQHYINHTKQSAIQLNLNGKYTLFNQKHDVFLGYTYSNENTRTTWQRIRYATPYNPLTFTGSEVAQPNWNQYSDQIFYGNRIASHALMLGTRFNATDKLHLLVGARYTKWKNTSYTDYHWWNNKADSDTDEYSTLHKNRLTPYFGVTYDISPQQSVYASYTSIFKPTSAQNKNKEYLDPVLGYNSELGWKAEWFNRKLHTSVAVFQIDHKNRVAQYQDPSDNKWYNENIGRVRSRGFDAEISGNLTENWKLFAGYTFNRSKYLVSENGRNAQNKQYFKGANYSLHTPKHLLRLYTSYQLPIDNGKWTVGAGMNFQSETSSLGFIEQKSYALFNANIQYTPNKHLSINLIGSNLGDKRYFLNHKTRYKGINNHYGEPRNITLKLNWKFK